MEIDFTQPAPRPKTLKEAQEIIDALWQFCAELSKRVDEQQQQIAQQQQQIAQQQKKIEELEEKLKINSKNSSKPPSSDLFKKKNKAKKKNKSKRSHGGQVGHKGISRSLLPIDEVDYIKVCKPDLHCSCGAHITLTGNYSRHQVHELPPIKAVVTEYQLCTGICEGCKKTYQAELPVGVPSGMLGPMAMAKIATLTGDYKLSKRKVTYLFEDFYGLKISLGPVANTEQCVSAALKTSVEEAKQFIPQQNSVNSDETGHLEKGKRMWTWTVIASLVAIFVIRVSRGAAVIKELLGDGFKGILCSDRFSSYNWMAAIFRQLCWAHLKRDFKKISERSGKAGKLGDELLLCYKRIFFYWHKFMEGKINREKFKKIMKPIRKQVEKILQEGTFCNHKKTARTCKQILKVKEALWTFVEQENIEPTNNLAEQVLRRIVIWRKTSFGTQSPSGTLYLERVMTVVASCKLQKRNGLNFITEAIQAHISGTQYPSLIPEIEHEIAFLKAA